MADVIEYTPEQLRALADEMDGTERKSGHVRHVTVSGIGVDDGMRPLAQDGSVAVDGVRAAGGCLGGATRWREKSGEGIALASALRAADSILGSL